MGSGASAVLDDRKNAAADPGQAPDVPLDVEPLPPPPSIPTPAPVPPPVADIAAPPYHVSEVAIDGVMNGDRADLTVRINIEVNRAGGWFDVPLRLGQAHIYRQKSSGVGSRLPGQPALQDDGLHWRFFGQGQHTLEFELGVPVRSTPSGRQMQLSLPVMPPLFEAQVRLRIPGGNYIVRSSNREAALRTEFDAAKNETVVTGGSPAGRLELSWQDRNLRPPADGVASTTYTLRRRGAGWEMDAQQTLIRMESPSNEILIRIPEGFEFNDVTGPLLEDREEVPGRPGWFRLNFVEGVSDRIELRWKLERPLGATQPLLSLSGFEIESVRTHDGRIRILPAQGLQLFPQQSSLRYVERVEDIPPVGEPPAMLTYAFSASDWRLTLELRPIEPLFACRPRVDLNIREDLATLTAAFDVHEEAGEVTRMVVDVSALEAAGWMPAIGPRLASSGATMTRSGSEVTFEWASTSSGPKFAELRYERSLKGAEFNFLVPPPVPAATWTEPAVVTVRAADPLRIDVRAATPTSEPQVESAVPSENSRLIGAFRQAVASEPLAVHGSVEARTISATANVYVEAVETRRMTVEQQVMLDVRYGRMDALRLNVPPEFPVTPGAERLAFQVWVDGREVTDLEWTSGSLRVPFARPRIGLIRVSIRYALPRTPEQAGMTVPVVLTPDVKFHELTMEASPAARTGINVADSNWKEIVTSSDRRRWSADPQAESAAITFESGRPLVQERAVISAAFIRTELTPGGVHRTVASYEIDRSGDTLTITLPPSATSQGLTINGLPAETLPTPSGTPGNVVTMKVPPAAGDGATRLRVAYDVMPQGGSGAIGRVRVAFPQFVAGTYIDQLIWKIDLPETDVLFCSPPGMSRLFEWQRVGLFWRRVLSPAYLATLKDAGFEADGTQTGVEGYAYRQIGAPASLVIWTIDRSLVILIGAGVTLVLGFAFWTIRSLQNVVVLLFLAFLISVAGLWFPEAIQVLLQPALVGVVMAMAATAVDGRTRRRRYRSPARESSIQPAVRTPAPKVNDPLRSTILRPTGSDHGVPR
ncbi:hypothetical protein [Caulifigura coniformis]|nr:hypothetical protein [Caulifigura coniformis]